MLREIDHFYLNQKEPTRSALLALRQLILAFDSNITAEWKYRMPFFYYKGKMYCYIWKDKKNDTPYIGFMNGKKLEHPELVQNKRAFVKILYVDPHKDLPVRKINSILKASLAIIQEQISSKKKHDFFR
jgi:Domain of unknown function (DU1801)